MAEPASGRSAKACSAVLTRQVKTTGPAISRIVPTAAFVDLPTEPTGKFLQHFLCLVLRIIVNLFDGARPDDETRVGHGHQLGVFYSRGCDPNISVLYRGRVQPHSVDGVKMQQLFIDHLMPENGSDVLFVCVCLPTAVVARLVM